MKHMKHLKRLDDTQFRVSHFPPSGAALLWGPRDLKTNIARETNDDEGFRYEYEYGTVPAGRYLQVPATSIPLLMTDRVLVSSGQLWPSIT